MAFGGGLGGGRLGGGSKPKSEPVYVIPMALALVAAAFTGAAMGLIWDTSGFGQDTPVDDTPIDDAAEAAEAAVAQ